MKRKGFTLIELLAVVMVLAVIAVVSVPIVLDVIDNARKEANMNTVYGIIDGAKMYYADAMFDEEKWKNIEDTKNIYDDIVVNGEKPSGGKLYIDEQGKVSIYVEIGNTVYEKGFDDTKLTEKEKDDNNEDDTIPPTVELGPNIEITPGKWISGEPPKIEVDGEDIDQIKWCQGIDCDPNNGNTIIGSSGTIIPEDGIDTQICVIVYDKAGNASEKVCTEIMDIDTTAPEFSGIADITVNVGEQVDLSKDVIVKDVISGVDGTYSYEPKTIDTSVTGTTEVVYTAKDLAGNVARITRKVTVSATAPTISYTAESGAINNNGWAKEEFSVTINVVDHTGKGLKEFRVCTATTDTCDPVNGSVITNAPKATRDIVIESNNNRICVQATDNDNKTSEIVCSDAYKLDKTKPTAGTIKVNGSSTIEDWYAENVTIEAVDGSDALSGHLSTVSDITSITSSTTSSGQVVTVTTTDLAGNTATNEYTIKVDKTKPEVTITKDSESAKLTAEVTPTSTVSGYSYQWYKDGKAIIAETSNTYTPTEIGTYKVVVTTGAGAIDSSDETTINNYTIKYDMNGGTGSIADQTKVQNIPLTLSEVKPEREGYTFQGWATSKTATEKEYSSAGTYTANAGTTLYAVWKVNSYTCAAGYYLGTNATSCTKCEAGSYCKGGTYNYSSAAQGKATCPTGYGTSEAGSNESSDCYKTVKATFNSNGATLTGTTTPTCNINYGQTGCEVTAPTISREGYIIVGFNESSTSSTSQVNSGAKVTLSSDKTYYAITKQVVLTLTDTSGTTYVGGNNLTTKVNTEVSKNYGTLTCTSSDNSVATCSVSGTTITMTPGSKAGSAVITVSEGNISKTAKYTFNNLSQSFAINATFTPVDAKYYENNSVRYWLNENYYVNVAVTSAETISRIEMCTATTNTCDPTGKSSVNGTSGSMLIAQESNNNRVCVQAYDSLGRKSGTVCSEAYGLDKTLPTITYNTLGGTYGSNKTITVTANDANFSHMSIHVYKDGSITDKSVNEITNNTYTVTLDSSGSWRVYAKAFDLAGNKQDQEPNNGESGWYYQEYLIDKNNPTCTFSTLSYLGLNKTATIELTCTNSISGMNDKTLSASDFTVSNASITGVTKTSVTNGYKYTITLKGTATGTATVTLPAGKVTTKAGLGNTAKTSGNITVTSVSLGSTSGTGYVGGSNLTTTITSNNAGTLTCSSSSNSIATCSISGTTLTIVPVGNGTATITVTGNNGKPTATYTATSKVVTLGLSSTSGTWYNGSVASVDITGSNYGTLSCSSSNESNATCSISGTTLKINMGPNTFSNATITVTESNLNKTVTYEYISELVVVNYSPPSIIFLSEGSVELAVAGTNYETISCTSSDTSIATCSISGTTLIITPKAAGKVSIRTVESKSNETWSYTITVSNDTPLCRRAYTLHTETCNQDSTSEYCGAHGYAVGDIITYGSLGTKGQEGSLSKGHAFDCDVNGDGVYDAETERFYYLSSLYNPTTKKTDSNYAVLIYYSNTYKGSPSNSSSGSIAYDSSGYNYYGPRTAISNLPTTSQWKNVSLSSTTRAILNQSSTNTTEDGAYTLPTAFSYSGYAARLASTREIGRSSSVSKTYNFLFENTKYADSSNGRSGYWTETPSSASNSDYPYPGYLVVAQHISSSRITSVSNKWGIRPVIEVPRTRISLKSRDDKEEICKEEAAAAGNQCASSCSSSCQEPTGVGCDCNSAYNSCYNNTYTECMNN